MCGPRVSAALTTIRSINKTDAVTLASTFGSVRGIMQASKAELAQCPGQTRPPGLLSPYPPCI